MIKILKICDKEYKTVYRQAGQFAEFIDFYKDIRRMLCETVNAGHLPVVDAIR